MGYECQLRQWHAISYQSPISWVTYARIKNAICSPGFSPRHCLFHYNARYHHRYWPFISLCWFVNFLYFRAVVSGLRCKIFMLWTDCLRWSHYQRVISRYENTFISKDMMRVKFPNLESTNASCIFGLFWNDHPHTLTVGMQKIAVGVSGMASPSSSCQS